MSPLRYPYVESPPPGESIEVAPGIFWLTLPLPFTLNHINVWLLRDQDGWTLVDTGLGLEDSQTIWQGVIQRLSGPIRRIVVTHFHPDHIGQAAWLQAQTGASISMSSGEFLIAHAVWQQISGVDNIAMVEHFRRHGLGATMADKMLASSGGYRMGVPQLPHTYQRLREGSELTIDGRSWRVIIGYGHAPEHVCLYCPSLKVLISGDMLLPRISTNISVYAATPDDDALADFLASLARFEKELPAKTLVLPSHGLPFIGIRPRVAALRAHHASHCDDIVTACRQARSAAELLPMMFPRDLDRYQTMFAMGEAIAHLNHLVHQGRLQRTVAADGIFRFVAPGQGLA